MSSWFKKNKNRKSAQNGEEKSDWSESLKRNSSLPNSAKQQDFNFEKNTDTVDILDVSCPMNVPSCNIEKISAEQVKILTKCQLESSAEALMKILKSTHKTRFKDKILNPLLVCGFFERTIPEKPKSPKQKYRLTDKFTRAKIL
jgi:ATP-dependent DNA helicase RecG